MPNETRGPDPLFVLMKDMDDGLPKLPATLTSISVLGQTYSLVDPPAGTPSTTPSFATALADHMAPYQAVETAHEKLAAAVEARAPVEAETKKWVKAAVTSFKGALGRTSASLKVVGIEPDKVPIPLTSEQKVERSEKSNATRKARGTKGKRQLAKIHGTVPAPTPPGGPTPPVAEPPPAAPAATKTTGS